MRRNTDITPRKVVLAWGLCLAFALGVLSACDSLASYPAWIDDNPPPSGVGLLHGSTQPHPKEIAGWRFTAYEQTDEVIRFYFQDPAGKRRAVVLEPVQRVHPRRVEAGRFGLFLDPDDPDPAALGLRDEIARRIEKYDTGDVVLSGTTGSGGLAAKNVVPNGSPPWLTPANWRSILKLELAASGLLLLFALLALLMLLPEVRRAWLGASPTRRWGVLALIAAGLLLRLAVPHQLVMVYGGYSLINQALALNEPLRYGTAGSLLYHMALKLLPGEGDAYMTLNTVMGALTLPLAAWWAVRYLKRPRLLVPLLALLVFMPLLVKDHNSESNMIPAMLMLFVGLLHWESFRQTQSRLSLFFAASALLFSILCRPLFVLSTPLALLALELGRGWGWLWPHRRLLILALFASLLALIPHLLFESVHYNVTLALGESRNLSGLVNGFAIQWLLGNLFLYPAYTALALPLLALLGYWNSEPESRRRLIALFVAGAALVAICFVDSPRPSLPRLQAGAMYFFTILSAVGLVQVKSLRVPYPALRRPGVWVALIGLTSLWPVATLWAPDVDIEEDRALRAIVHHLPPESVNLARLYYGDPPETWGVFRDYPDYRFSPPRREDRMLSLSDLDRLSELGLDDRETYLYLGTRCYAVEASRGEKIADPVTYEHPVCRRWRQNPDCEIVWEREAPNRRKFPDFTWYPDRPTLTLGLYRLVRTATDER